MPSQIVAKQNLSSDFELGTRIADKITVKLATQIADGIVKLSPAITGAGEIGKLPDGKQVVDYVTSSINAIVDKRVVGWDGYNPTTNMLTIRMHDNTTFDIDLTSLLNDAVETGVDEVIEDVFGVQLGYIRPL